MNPQNQPVVNQPIVPQMPPVMPQMPSTPPTMPPTMPPTPPIMPSNPNPHGDKKVGPIIATLVIVLILIIAALYLFASRINQPAIPDDDTVSAESAGQNGTAAPAAVEPVTGTSTDAASLQSDLNASTNGLDNQNF